MDDPGRHIYNHIYPDTANSTAVVVCKMLLKH